MAPLHRNRRRALAGVVLLLGFLGARAERVAGAPATIAREQGSVGDPGGASGAAIELYRAGEYVAAEQLWRARLEEARATEERADLCYDLGNACYRQEKYLPAVAWFQSALRLQPRDGAAWRNLELARAAAGLEPADRGDLASSLRRLTLFLTVGEWRALALGLCGALALALALEILRGGALFKALSWCVGSAAAACVAVLGWRAIGEIQAPAMIVERAGAALSSEPRADAAAVGRAEPGALVEVVDRYLDWVRVEGDGDTRGWVEASAVQALES